MAFGFNPFTGNFDLTGGGDAAPFAGQVDAYADLPLDTTAALNSRWLVKNNSGTWPFSSYKQAGIYIRVSTVGASRDTDYQFVGTLPSVMNDSEFLIYDDTDATKNLKFQLSGITTGTTRTLTAPDANITIENTGHAAKHHTGGTDAIAPNNISAQWELVASGQFIAGDTVLSSGRNRRITLSVVTTANVDLPYENNVNGDVVAFVKGQTGGATATIRRADALSGGVPFAWSTLATLTTVGQSFTFVSDGTATGWTLRDVDTHTHAASAITSGVFDNARINFAAPEAIGNTTPAAGSFTTLTSSSDTEVTDSTKGVILKSPNNTRWRITINDDGTLARAALALMTLLAFATSGLAQVRDIVTDTNGNIITGRTNELVWSNNLRFTPLTNANAQTAIIGTNGALSAGNPPSAAAANGALLTADGAGGSSFVESRTQFSRIMSATSRSNWTNNDWNFAVNDDTNASLSLAANTIYRVTWNLNIQVATNTLSWGYTLAATATFITNLQRNGTYQFRDGSRTVGWETSAGQSTAVRGDGGGQILEARTNMDRIVGGSMVVQTGTNAATLYFRWWPGQNTNQPVSLGTNSWLHAEKLN
jgi:hypothetical protein